MPTLNATSALRYGVPEGEAAYLFVVADDVVLFVRWSYSFFHNSFDPAFQRVNRVLSART